MTDSNQQPDATRGKLDAMLVECVRLDGSDLHLSAGLPPYWRVHGVLKPRDGYDALTAAELEQMAAMLFEDVDDTTLNRRGDQDGAISAPDGTRFRFNVFRRQGHLSIALRRLEEKFQTLAELGLPDSLYELCNYSDGLIIVAGPTGAGKSTTLATLLHRINENRRCHIVTIEDPIEYLHKPLKSLVNQRQIGSDASTFNDALVASLRQDPDVILVGEIRDLNTIRTAITAAETGHLVLTTVHAGDCVGSIERLVSVFPADEQDGVRRQLSLVLRAVIAQHLLVADGSAGGARDDIEAVDATAKGNEKSSAEPTRRKRVVASEVLRASTAVANLIATGKSAQIYSAMETGGSFGMQTLEQDLARLWTSNLISETAAMAVSRSPQILRDRAAGMRNPGSTARQRIGAAGGGRR